MTSENQYSSIDFAMRVIGKIINYFFKTPLNSYKRYLILRRAVKIGGFALENGTYFMSPNYKSIEKKQVKRVSNGNKVLFLLNLVLRNKLTIKNNTNFELISDRNEQLKRYSGDLLLVSNAGLKQLSRYNFKIFDSTNKLVFSFFTNNSEFNKYKDGAKFFGSFYSVPKILFRDKKRNYVVEEKVLFIEHLDNRLKQEVQHEILKGYIQSIEKIESSWIELPKIRYQSKDKEVGSLIELMNKTIDNLSVKKLPKFIQHGDLSLSNVLIEKTTSTPYIIDWEHMDEYILFYDPFWNWINESIWNNDYSLLRLYLTGEYDAEIIQVLRVFQLEILLSNKIELILIVLVEMLNKRIFKEDFSDQTDVFLRNKVSAVISEIDQLIQFKTSAQPTILS